MIRILAGHPGARFSVGDVFDGLVGGLKRRDDVQLIQYRMDGRWDICARALELAYRRNGKKRGQPRPTTVDVAYWASEGIIERALRHQPEWVVLVTSFYFQPMFLELLKRAGFRTAIVLTESPYDDGQVESRLQLCDVAWTNERTAVDALRKINPNVYYLPHAYDPYKHRPDLPAPDDVPSHDVVFVGTGFHERVQALEAVDWDGIDFGLYGTWNLVGSRSKLRKHLRGPNVPNQMTTALYRRAKIGLNIYRTSRGYGRDAPRIERADSLNPRALELAACGLFHISDYRAEVGEVFGPLVPTFDPGKPGDLERLIRRWLADDEGRQAVSEWLPATVEGRSFDAMAAQVVSDLANN